MKYLCSLLVLAFISIEGYSQSRTVPILSHPASVEVEIVSVLNSSFRETNLSITPDGRYLYFMSGRGGQEWSTRYGFFFQGKREFDGDIWYSEQVDGEWQRPEVLDKPINSAQGEDEPNISPDGQRVRFQSWNRGWEKTGGPYYESTLSGVDWGKPKGLGSGINQFFVRHHYATDGMSISPNGEYYIVAAGPNYDGRLDLYLSRHQADGSWTYPRPLSVNTRKDERSIFIAGDSKTLYFASDGYGGMGGLDLFKGVLQPDGTISDIVNLGAPFNTKADDYGFLLTADGREAYFVRDGDIYFADLTEADPGIKPGATLLINGTVKTEKGKALASEIELVDPKSGQLLAEGLSNSRNGEYALAIAWKPGPFVMRAQPKSYYAITETIRKKEVGDNRSIRLDFVFSESLKVITRGESPSVHRALVSPTPTPVDLDEPFVLLFDHNSATVKKEYAHLLQGLAKLQKKYPDLRLALDGHTDSNGSDGFNLDLSHRRVMAVARCLQMEGAERARLWWDYCGEAKPVADNEEEFGRADNRRVEIKIVRVED
ncbi:MAG: OmpA family protein [Bacteroidota bacterium]